MPVALKSEPTKIIKA